MAIDRKLLSEHRAQLQADQRELSRAVATLTQNQLILRKCLKGK